MSEREISLVEMAEACIAASNHYMVSTGMNRSLRAAAQTLLTTEAVTKERNEYRILAERARAMMLQAYGGVAKMEKDSNNPISAWLFNFFALETRIGHSHDR